MKKIIKLKEAAASAVRAGRQLADLVYPPDIYCIGCSRPLAPGRLYSMCDDCLAEISWANGKLCAGCGRPLEEWYPDRFCSECINRDRSFDAGMTCFLYKDTERNVIKDLKYHGKSYLARILSEIMADKADASHAECDIIIPVPMYRKKEKSRGYNQAGLLAEFLADRLGIPYRDDILIRKRDTQPMNRLNSRERRRNLDDAFCIRQGTEAGIKGRRIMLVDDIFTTGTTTEKCSSVLKAGGALSVTVMSLASGGNQRPLPDITETD